MNMIHEWIPSEALRSTVEIWGRPDGWIEGIGITPEELKPWRGSYELPASREIREYLEGERRSFSHLDLVRARIGRISGPFYRATLLRAMEIPYGETMAYSDLAEAQNSKAWRAVGSAMAGNPIPIIVPCHRVVAKHGLGGFGGHVWLKRKLLELEGADIP